MKKLTLLFLSAGLLLSCGAENTSNTPKDGTTENSLQGTSADYEAVVFEAADGLLISGNLYEVEDPRKVILLCHQARFNKFEYQGIGQRLNEMGYTCLAIDQRSGGPIADQLNETNLRAKEEGMAVDYLNARPDIHAGVAYLYEKYDRPVVLWGSSYSSTLVLYEAVENEQVEAVVSFSPGDYFADTLGSLVPLMATYEKPFFLTSGNWEAEEVSKIISGKTLNERQVQFIPEGEGHHGSRALWTEQEGGEEYWKALSDWLEKL